MLGDTGEGLGEVGDEVERRLADVLFVPALVGLEPCPVVVGCEVLQEGE